MNLAPIAPPPPSPPPTPGVWWAEPARIIGHIASAVIGVAATVAALLTQYGSLVPDKYKSTATTIIAVCGAVGVVASQVQAWVTRQKVYSPVAAHALFTLPSGGSGHSSQAGPGAAPAGPFSGPGVPASEHGPTPATPAGDAAPAAGGEPAAG